MRKIMVFVAFIFIGCGKTNMVIEQAPKFKVETPGMFQVVHDSTLIPGHFCLGTHPEYDTVYLVPPKDYTCPWVNQDSVIGPMTYVTYVVKKIK